MPIFLDLLLTNYSLEIGTIINFFSTITCDSPELWQLRLQDPASSTMEGILLFNRHLLFIITMIASFTSSTF